MNRIESTFKKLRKAGKKAFIPYITAGDPDIATTKKIVCALEKAGADIIELGIPFSDPLADGPTIQKAIERSLKAGCTVKKVLDMVKQLRKMTHVPFVFMTYYNIVFNYGLKRFVRDTVSAGADGIIVPDLPMEEAGELIGIADREDFCVIQLSAPTTPPDRFKKIAKASRGFIYYVSLTGVTGMRKDLGTKLPGEIKKLKKMTRKPVCVGFGISNSAQAGKIASLSDGAIVGSALIKVIERGLNQKNVLAGKVEAFIRPIANAVHKV